MFFDIFYSLCQKRGISCKRAVSEMGLSNSIATKWKKTGATPSGDTLQKIATYFNVPLDYLLGTEPEHDILDDVDVAFYGDYRELTEDDKETLRAMARLMRDRHNKKNKE